MDCMVLNPKTKRYIVKYGNVYNRLVASGDIEADLQKDDKEEDEPVVLEEPKSDSEDSISLSDELESQDVPTKQNTSENASEDGSDIEYDWDL